MTFPIHNEDKTSNEAQRLLAETKAKLGMVPNVEKVMAAAPQILASYKFMWSQYDTVTLTPIEQQIVHMTSNFENDCAYCVPWHSVIS